MKHTKLIAIYAGTLLIGGLFDAFLITHFKLEENKIQKVYETELARMREVQYQKQTTLALLQQSYYQEVTEVLNTVSTMVDISKSHEKAFKRPASTTEECLDIYRIIEAKAYKYDLDFQQLLSQVGQESAFIPTADSYPHNGRVDRGLGQISPDVLDIYNKINKTSYNELDLYIPEINIEVMAWYLQDNKKSLEKRGKTGKELEDGILYCYNSGYSGYLKGRGNPEYVEAIENKKSKLFG